MRDTTQQHIKRTTILIVAIIILSALSAHTVSRKELNSLVLWENNASQSVGDGSRYEISEADVKHANGSRSFYFYIFSMALIPLMLCATKPRAQKALVYFSVFVFLFSLIAGTENTLLLSAFVLAVSTIFILAWLIIKLAIRLIKST